MKIKYWGWQHARLSFRKFSAGNDHSAYTSLVIGPVEMTW